MPALGSAVMIWRLPPATLGTFTIFAQVRRQHHVRERAEHGDQLGDVDELAEARHRPVFAGGLQLEFGRGVAEGGGPGVELVQATLAQRLRGPSAAAR